MTVTVQDAAGNHAQQVIFESEPETTEPIVPELPDAPIEEEAIDPEESDNESDENAEDLPDTNAGDETTLAWTSVKLATSQPIKLTASENSSAFELDANETTAEMTALPNLKLVAPIYNEQPYSGDTIHSAPALDGPARSTAVVSPTVVDVTQQATYTVAKKNIVSVSNKGVVTAKTAGTTTITVKYRGNEVKVLVTVTKQEKPSKPTKPGKPNHNGKPGNNGKPNKPGNSGGPGNPGKPGKN